VSLLDRFWGSHSQSTYQRGMHAFNAGQLEEALEAFRKVLETHSGASDPLVSLSRFYASEASHTLGTRQLLAGEIDVALQFFRAALAWNDQFPELQFHAAIALVWSGKLAAARRLLEGALAQNPDHFEARLLLAELAFREQAQAEGELHLQQASERGCHRPLDEGLVQLLKAGAHESIAAMVQQSTSGTLRHSV